MPLSRRSHSHRRPTPRLMLVESSRVDVTSVNSSVGGWRFTGAGRAGPSLFLYPRRTSYNRCVAAEVTLEKPEPRVIYMDRRVCSVKPDKIDVHPARSIIFLPIITLLVGLAAFPAIFFLGDSLSIPVRMLMTFGAIILVPISGLGIVYSIAGAHVVIDRAKQSAVLQQGYLGMGVGTQELIPFWKVDAIVVEELTPHDWRGHQEDFAQYEVYIRKASGKHVSIGMITTARTDAEPGLERATEIATLIAEMAGAPVEHVNDSQEDGFEPAGEDHATALEEEDETDRT